MADYNKKCLLCGKDFKFCPTCYQKSPADAWKNIFDKENCRIIFNLVCDFAQKEVDVETAKDILSRCDLSDKDSYKVDIKGYIDEILATPTQLENDEDELDFESEEESREIKEEEPVKKEAPKKMRRKK